MAGNRDYHSKFLGLSQTDQKVLLYSILCATYDGRVSLTLTNFLLSHYYFTISLLFADFSPESCQLREAGKRVGLLSRLSQGHVRQCSP
jgi:hypothetical protein